MAMLNFGQIKNGLLIEAMLVSYEAAKVLTNITKPDSDDVYNVNELLTLLKSKSEAVKFEDLETNLQEVIRTAATPEIFDPTSLVEAIEALEAGQKRLETEVTPVLGEGDSGYDENDYPMTEFTLAYTPTAEKVKVYINTVPYIEDEDDTFFTVDRTLKKVTWTFGEAAGGFDIDHDLTDAVTVEYFTTDPVVTNP